MRDELIAAGLWDAQNPIDPSQSVTAACQVMSRTGASFRYQGRSECGTYHYLVYEPVDGTPIAVGSGESAALAICRAAYAVFNLQSN